jgi:hypothetical protein
MVGLEQSEQHKNSLPKSSLFLQCPHLFVTFGVPVVCKCAIDNLHQDAEIDNEMLQ